MIPIKVETHEMENVLIKKVWPYTTCEENDDKRVLKDKCRVEQGHVDCHGMVKSIQEYAEQ